MTIGIDGSRAFIKNRTGIEEYSYRVIKNLIQKLPTQEVVLYVRKNQVVDFELPEKWKIKVIKFPRFWTQIGLSLEMLLHPVDVLFVPAHTVPLIHPKNTVVTIHGLEYEFCPKSYSRWDRFYMRASIKNSCRWASRIISVSENTKRDLEKLYDVASEKISVIYEGYDHESESNIEYEMPSSKYLLFVGRIEERKNIGNVVKAFEILKGKYEISHDLILAGRSGYGYQDISAQITSSKYCNDIKTLGFIDDQAKFELMKRADVFVFPTLYEGFGIPVLEAQSVGCSVVASNNSSIPEVTKDSALLVDPKNPEDIAENIYEIISNESLKNAIILKGLENVKRFSWDKCAEEIAETIKKYETN